MTSAKKILAERYLRANFVDYWSPEAAQHVTPIVSKASSKKKAKSSLIGAMLNMDDDEDESSGPSDVEGEGFGSNELFSVVNTEVDRYLQMPQIAHVTEEGSDTDILVWWKERSKDFPYLSKMARQFLALPCSSAGMGPSI